jgi:hypothetical protein
VVGTIFHLDDGYQLLAVAGTFADAALCSALIGPTRRFSRSLLICW